jgi:CheY-like chemotaxis protein
MPSHKPKVLIAEVPRVIPVVEDAWGGYFDLTYCLTMQEAICLLQERFDVIVCGTHFADSHMFDLLRHAKATPQSRDTPFLCIRALDGELDATAFQSISMAVKALAAAGFVDLNRWRREYGFDEARVKLRQLVFELAGTEHLV